MTPNIDSIINPKNNYTREGDSSSNINNMIALHELELAKKVTLELIRDCSKEVQSSIKKAFDSAILEIR
tara:strand:+ start:295 stop:501 length:207 start_codon:yes stop_codon:yes gene_type:complete